MQRSCLIVDDSQEFLEVAARLLEAEGMVVAGLSTSGADAVARVAALRPDVVLVDVELGDEDGVALAARLASGATAPAVIVISSHDHEGLLEVLQAGAIVGFLRKDALSVQAIDQLLHQVD